MYTIPVIVLYVNLPFVGTRVHPLFWWDPCCSSVFSFFCCPIVCLDVLSSVLWCPLQFLHTSDVQVRSLYLQMFVGGFMSYLRYLCLLAHSGIQHMLWCIFCFVCPHLVICVPNVASFSGLFILDYPFGFLWRLFISNSLY